MEPDPCSLLLASVPSGLVLVKGSLAAPTTFLLPWLIRSSLADGGRVVVLAAAQSPARYRAALRKVAPAGGGAGGGGEVGLTYVCPLTPHTPTTQGAPGATGTPPQQQQPPPAAAAGGGAGGAPSAATTASFTPSLQALLQQLLAAAHTLCDAAGSNGATDSSGSSRDPSQQGQAPTGLASSSSTHSSSSSGSASRLVVVLDSLPALCCLYPGLQQQAAFLHYLGALGQQLAVPVTVVVLASEDIPAHQQHLAALSHQAAALVQLVPVEGGTADLDGQLLLQVRHAPQQGAQQGSAAMAQAGGVLAPGAVGWFYRCGDTAVRWLSEVSGRELLA